MKHLVCFLLSFLLASSVLGQVPYERHVFFDNSRTDSTYFYSEASVVGLSELAHAEEKVPVTEEHFFNPPNALRLEWTSRTGGDWRVVLHRAHLGTVHGRPGNRSSAGGNRLRTG